MMHIKIECVFNRKNVFYLIKYDEVYSYQPHWGIYIFTHCSSSLFYLLKPFLSLSHALSCPAVRLKENTEPVMDVPALWPPLAPSSWPAVPSRTRLDSAFSGTPSPAPPAARWWTWSGVSSSCCWTHYCRTCPPCRPSPSSPARWSPGTRAGCNNCPWTCRGPSAKCPRPFWAHRNWLERAGDKEVMNIFLYFISAHGNCSLEQNNDSSIRVNKVWTARVSFYPSPIHKSISIILSI